MPTAKTTKFFLFVSALLEIKRGNLKEVVGLLIFLISV